MSLRLRLLIAVAVTALVALIGADVATYSAFRSYLNGQLDSTLGAGVVPIEGCLDQGGHLTISLVEESSPGIFAEVRTTTGQVRALVPAVDEDRQLGTRLELPPLQRRIPGSLALRRSSLTDIPVTDDCKATMTPATRARVANVTPQLSGSSKHVGPAVYFTAESDLRDQPSYRIRVSKLSDGRLLVMGLPLTENGAALGRLLLIELGVSAAALLVALGLGLLLVRIGVRPLEEVEQTAESIMEGDLGARVPERFGGATEMGRLTRVLNLMLGRLSEDFEERDRTEKALRRSETRMRQFLADASHELRTPIAAVSAYAELFSRGADSRPADLERILSGIQSETARMSRLVTDLLLLANLDEGRPLERRPVELVALCAEAVHAASAVGSEWPIELHAAAPVEVIGDEARLRQVVDNLLANIRGHTPPGTSSSVIVATVGGEAVIEVADRGPGLGEEGRRRLFERFFRQDTSRARASGGAGLGLAIVQAIVEAHGGSVEAAETRGGGATFVVRLPGVDDDDDDDDDDEEAPGLDGPEPEDDEQEGP